MIEDSQNVARALFTPIMVNAQGKVLNAAFKLRSGIKEEYISVMIMDIPTWLSDIEKIPQNENRKLYGYARMNAGQIRQAKFDAITFDVKECPTANILSHGGIFTYHENELIIGGQPTKGEATGGMLLAIRNKLAQIAQEGLVVI